MAAGTVVAEGGLEGRQLLDAAGEGFVEGEEREGLVAHCRHLVGLAGLGDNLETAMQGIEAGEVGGGTDDVEGGESGRELGDESGEVGGGL